MHTALQTEIKAVTRKLSQTPGAIRQRRLRERRRNGWRRMVLIEVAVMDVLALRHSGYLRPDEPVRGGVELALGRVISELRNALPDTYKR